MELLKKVVYVLNLSLWFFPALYFLFTKIWMIGGMFLSSSIMFVIGYKLSESMIVSRRVRYRNSEWRLFMKKVSWAHSVAGMALGFFVFVFGLVDSGAITAFLQEVQKNF